MTCPTSVSIFYKKKQSVFVLQPCSGFGVCSSQTQKETRSVESFSPFAMLKQWPSTQEHVFKFHSLNSEQILYSCQVKVNRLYGQSIVT